MTLDNEKQRAMLLEMLAAVQFPGSAVDDVYELKYAIKDAKVEETNLPAALASVG